MLNARAVLVGLLVGLVLGGGIASVIWALTTDDDTGGGTDADVAAVCGVIQRTPMPDEDTSIEDRRRWAVAEVMPSVAKADPEYQPLADALEKAVRAMQQFQPDEMRAAIDDAKRLCATG